MSIIFSEHGYMPSSLNHTFPVMIPKFDKAQRVDQFRPITLCNIIYKVIAKILANKLKLILDNIISPWQAVFIPGLAMFDNSIISHECMHYINKKKSKMCFMACKIDMART